MKKGFFIVGGSVNDGSGVSRKIRSQIDAFRRAGIDIEPYEVSSRDDLPGYKLLFRLPFTNVSPVWPSGKALEKFRDIDFIYMRRPMFCNCWFIRFLRGIRAVNPGIKIIYELPTYPYDKEISMPKLWPIYLKDILARRHLRKYVDRIAVLSDEDEIWGCKTLQITNGYDFAKQTVRDITPHGEVINIAVVAMFAFWHGYERLINGLCEYYKAGGKRKFVLHFAGEGSELSVYRKLAKERGAESFCVFYGMQTQEQLKSIYDKCDIAASSFGGYKKNVYKSYELKSREYLAKGLPMITGCELDLEEIDELREYILRFPNDSSDVRFELIAEFYDRLYSGKSDEDIREMCRKIRRAGEENFSMDTAMKNVIEYINQP